MTEPLSKRPHRILMVDDDAVLRTALGLVLSQAGYEVGHADNGREAMLLHRRDPFDVVVAEILLPEKDGLETLMELRRQPSPARFIAMSKKSRIPSRLFLRMAEYFGADHILAKPFQPEQLLAAVQNVLSED